MSSNGNTRYIGVRLHLDLANALDKHCKHRGDRSRLINQAVREYLEGRVIIPKK